MRNVLLALLLMLSPLLVFGQTLLSNPESVVYDVDRERYLVSNVGDGHIIAFNPVDSSQTLFSDTLDGHWGIGMRMHEGVLYVAIGEGDMAGVAGFDPATGEMVFHVVVPEADLLNDLAFDSTGLLFVTDYWGSRLFSIDVTDSTVTMVTDTGMDYPNGCIYDEPNHRLLFVSNTGAGRPIRAYDIAENTINDFFYTGLSGMDGIVFDADSNLYVSSWDPDYIYRLDYPYDGNLYRFSSGHLDPADIYFDPWNSCIVVPNYSRNTLDFVPVQNTSAPERGDRSRKIDYTLLETWPNPVNGSVTIRYSLPQPGEVTLRVFDILGREIALLHRGYQAAGSFHQHWNTLSASGVPVPSGTYIVLIESHAQATVSRRIHIIR